MPPTPSLTSTAKKYSKNSTFQSTAIVVFFGIIMLIWMLTNENDSHYQTQMAKKASKIKRPKEKSGDKHHMTKKSSSYSDNNNNHNNNDHRDDENDDDDATDDDFYRKQQELDQEVENDPNQEDDPFHIQAPDYHQAEHLNNNHNHHGDENDNGEGPLDGKKLVAGDKNAVKEYIKSSSVKFREAKKRNQEAREYLFDLDKPRKDDEQDFFHLPKSAGGILVNPEKNIKVAPNWTALDGDTRKLAQALYYNFELFDADEESPKTMPFYGTMCVGRDCQFIPEMAKNLRSGIGHFIVVVNTDDEKWENMFSLMQELFPGRFTKFLRPEKLSCAESWNVIVRMGFTQRPMPDQVFIANADWHPRPSRDVANNFARYCEFSRTKLHLVASRYFHFSSFSFTQKGYKELGYFDEVIYPALAEDVEFHIKAVSKGLGELGMYDNWNEGSKHITRASAADEKISDRNGRVARFDYILRKWNVRVPSHRDFAQSHPYRQPWNNKYIFHNNSWVVDPDHRKCANTGKGKVMASGRCFYNVSVLQKLMPEGVTLKLSDSQTTFRDSFPGGYH